LRNEYVPHPAVIESIQMESFDTKTFKIAFEDKFLAESFYYKPGQFVQVSLLGIGEAPISIASCPGRKGFLELTIRATGKLTRAIHQLEPGDKIHLRGPYGNSFPLEEVAGKDLYFIAGGIGLPPLRGLIKSALYGRDNFGKIKILYGAKTPDELCFKEELKTWRQVENTEIYLTVDEPDQSWQGDVGVVTKLWDKADMATSDGIAYVCGPPIMIKFVVVNLLESGFKDKNIYITLERYMKCGIGKCGHCNIGEKFVCTDGPVFSYAQLKEFPDKERAIA
jgi:sulfhydrogenase subunit gamma (sulfur reductase)